jgi:Zn-dependent protease
MQCPGCGTEHSSRRLDCPVCHRLVHREALEELAAEAENAHSQERPRDEIEAWRRALALLPPESDQARTIATRVEELSTRLDDEGGESGEAEKTLKNRLKWARFGAIGLVIWKLKSIAIFVVTKGKFVLLGLTKSSTFLSMFLSMGVYWAAFGWQFALGLVVSIYVHEMGHVAALFRFGIPASPPMFVPGLGAFVRLGQYPMSPREDARVGLAGPIYGLGAATVAFGMFAVTGLPIWGAIAKVGAWINLFNLIPVWQLDGARGMRALGKTERFVVAAVAAGLFFWSQEGLLLVLAVAGGVQALRTSDEPGDRTTLVHFLGLLVFLSALIRISVTT